MGKVPYYNMCATFESNPKIVGSYAFDYITKVIKTMTYFRKGKKGSEQTYINHKRSNAYKIIQRILKEDPSVVCIKNPEGHTVKLSIIPCLLKKCHWLSHVVTPQLLFDFAKGW